MARRINTKFVVIMTTALVVMVTGAVLLALKVQKTFAEHMAMGDEALVLAEQNLAAGDDEAANTYYRMAWEHYGRAYGDDPTRIDVLYQSVDIFRKYGCTTVTEAKNQLDQLINYHENAHSHNNATSEDRQRYFDLLYRYHRQGLTKDGLAPWLGTINQAASDDVRGNPNDKLALRYMVVTGTLMYRMDMRETEIVEMRTELDRAVELMPNYVQVLAARGLFEVRQAQRIRQLEGNANQDDELSDEAKAHYTDAAEYLSKALAVTEGDAFARINALTYATLVPDSIMDRAALLTSIEKLLAKLNSDATARDDLTANELISMYQVVVQITAAADREKVAEIAELAGDIANQAAEEHPDQSAYRRANAQALMWRNKHEAAAEQARKGLAIERRRNAEEYLLHLTTRVALNELSIQAALGLAEAAEDADTRQGHLDAARSALKNFRDAEGGTTGRGEAMGNYYAGRISLIEGDYHTANRWLDEANRLFNRRHAPTLQLLGDIAVAMENSGKAAQCYGLVLQIKKDTQTHLKLIRVYLNLRNLDEAGPLIEQYIKQYPDDIRGYTNQAQALAIAGRPEAAVELLESLELQNEPSIMPTLAGYMRQAGQTDQAIQMLRDRLAEEPNDQAVLPALLGLLEGKDARLAEIDRLQQADPGLDPERADTLRQLLRLSDSTNPEDQEELVRLNTGGDPVRTALSLYQLFINRGESEQAEEALAQAVALDPDHPGVLELQFQRAMQTGDRELAYRTIDRLMALPPKDRPRFAGDRVMLRTMAEAAYQLQQGSIDDDTRRDLISRYRKGLANDPNMLEGWIQLSQLLALSGDWSQARDAALKAYELQPNNARAVIVYSQMLANNGDLATALRVLEEAMRANGSARIRQEYLAIAQRGGFNKILLEERERVRDLQPEDYNNRRALAELYLASERLDQAREEIESVIAAEGPNINSTWILARILFVQEQPGAARRVVEQYVASLGDTVSADDHMLLARVLLLVGEIETALSAYASAAAADESDNNLAARVFAALLIQAGQPLEAAKIYRELADKYPDEQELKIALSQSLLIAGAYEQAATELAGVDESPQTMLIRFELATRQDEPERARELLSSAYQKYPENDRVALVWARTLLNEGEAKQAGPVVRSLVQRAGSSNDVQMLLVRLELLQENRESAQTRLQSLVQNAPNYFPARELLFNLLQQDSLAMAPINPAKSREIAEQALDTIVPLADANPDNLQANLLAGQAARFANKPGDAIPYYERAYQIDGGANQLAALARALVEAEFYARAIELLRAPENASALNQSIDLTSLWARALAGAGQTEQAVNLYASLLRDNTDTEVRVRLSMLILASFDLDRGIAVIDNALEDQRFAQLDLLITQSLIQAGLWSKALARADRYVTSPAKNPDVQVQILGQIALACQQTEEFERAKRLYEEVLEDDPDNLNALNNLAYMLSEDLPGFEADALNYAQRAVDALEQDRTTSDLNRALVLDTLGWAQYRAGEYDKAIATLERSISIRKVHANSVHLARVHMGLGNTNRALRLLGDAEIAARRADNQAELDEIAQLIQELNQ